MSEEFVSRRGKRTKVDAESTPDQTPQPKQIQQRPKRQMILKMPTISFPKITVSRRAKLGMVIAIVLLAVVTLVTADSVKRDYERQTAAMRRSVTETSKTISPASITAAKTIDNLLSSLNASTTCRVSGIDVVSWYGPAKQARVDCQNIAQRYTELRSSLSRMKEINTYLVDVTDALAPAVAQPADSQYAIAGDYVDSWAKALEKMRSVVVPKSLSSQHQTLLARVETVKKAWEAMQQALMSKDVDGFKQAETSLQTNYVELRKSADDIRTQLTTIQAEILSSVNALQTSSK